MCLWPKNISKNFIFSFIARKCVCHPVRLDGLEGTDRPSRKFLDGSVGQSLAVELP